MEIQEIITIVIGGLGFAFGAAFFLRFRALIKVLAELGQALQKAGVATTATADALKDRKVTKAEAVLLLKYWQEVGQEFIDLYAALRELIPASVFRFLLRR